MTLQEIKKYIREMDNGLRLPDDDLNEEAPANNAGGGNIDGIGVGENGEPGVSRRRQKFWQNRCASGAEERSDEVLTFLRRGQPR